jgi:hypothetical protein
MGERPCTPQPAADCGDCGLTGRLMCKYDRSDTVHFFMIMMPFLIPAAAGAISGGLGVWLPGILGYGLFIFFGWDARVLCSHCLNWAAEGRMQRCHANYGVIKLWKFLPEPMSRSEQAQFLIGASLFIVFPLVILIIGRAYLPAIIALATAVSGFYLLRRNICARCISFSCPVNGVPKPLIDAYWRRAPEIRKLWMAQGFSFQKGETRDDAATR